MLYQFKCKECGEELEEVFLASEYDKKVTEDGRLKRKRCKKCKTLLIYRHITKTPSVLGGTKGYLSMERYWQQNPDIAKRKEAELEKIGQERRTKMWEAVDKQKERKGKAERDKNYGEGQKEEKLQSDD